MASRTARTTLRAFAFKEPDSLSGKLNTLNDIRAKLQQLTKAKDRCMLLSQSDPNQEKDLISNFEESDTPESIFCTMLRIAPGEDAQHVTNDLLEKHAFAMEELANIYSDQSDNSPPAVCKEHYYFSINNNHLVTNLRMGKTIRDLKVYLAWLLGDDLLELYPMTKPPNNLTLQQVRNITFSGASLSYTNRNEGPGEGTSKTESINIPKLAFSKLRDLLPGIKSLSQYDLERYISAELVLKIKNPAANEKEHFEKTMGALLLPVADLDSVSIRPKKGRAITGKELAREKPVEVAVTSSGQLVEQALRQEMSKFLNELGDA